MKLPNLSFSAFECYSQCPFKFKRLYLDKLRLPSNEYALFGVAFHNLLDQAYQTEDFILDNLLKKWSAVFSKEAKKKQYDCVLTNRKKFQEKRGLKEIKIWFEMASRERILRPCLDHELSLKGRFKEYNLKAKIDLVIEIKGGVGLIDWKTGSPDRSNLMQLALYSVIYQKRKGIKVDWIIPFYTKIKNVVYQECNDSLINEASAYFGDIYRKLSADTEYIAQTNKYCYFCNLKDLGECPLFESREIQVSI